MPIFGLIWIYILWKALNSIIIGCSTPTSLITHDQINELYQQHLERNK